MCVPSTCAARTRGRSLRQGQASASGEGSWCQQGRRQQVHGRSIASGSMTLSHVFSEHETRTWSWEKHGSLCAAAGHAAAPSSAAYTEMATTMLCIWKSSRTDCQGSTTAILVPYPPAVKSSAAAPTDVAMLHPISEKHDHQARTRTSIRIQRSSRQSAAERQRRRAVVLEALTADRQLERETLQTT